jgi:hypothetical protein
VPDERRQQIDRHGDEDEDVDEDEDDKISRRGDCRWVIACGFGTELCRQADVRYEECR